MKRLSSILLCTLLFLILPGCRTFQNSSGDPKISREKEMDAKLETIQIGSQEFCLIKTERDLQSIGGNYPLSGNYALANDLIMTGEWNPVGSPDAPFTGIFDGNGYVIYGLTVTEQTDPLGFFGGAKDASIQNLVLEEAHIRVNDSFPIAYHAIDTAIENCSINAGAFSPGTIEMELTENYSDSDPFVNARLFYVPENTDSLKLDVSFQMDGGSGLLEIADNDTGEVFWGETWSGSCPPTAFTVTLDHVDQKTEFVFRFTGTKIEYAKAEISSPDHLIRERTRPLHKKEL